MFVLLLPNSLLTEIIIVLLASSSFSIQFLMRFNPFHSSSVLSLCLIFRYFSPGSMTLYYLFSITKESSSTSLVHHRCHSQECSSVHTNQCFRACYLWKSPKIFPICLVGSLLTILHLSTYSGTYVLLPIFITDFVGPYWQTLSFRTSISQKKKNYYQWFLIFIQAL